MGTAVCPTCSVYDLSTICAALKYKLECGDAAFKSRNSLLKLKTCCYLTGNHLFVFCNKRIRIITILLYSSGLKSFSCKCSLFYSIDNLISVRIELVKILKLSFPVGCINSLCIAYSSTVSKYPECCGSVSRNIGCIVSVSVCPFLSYLNLYLRVINLYGLIPIFDIMMKDSFNSFRFSLFKYNDLLTCQLRCIYGKCHHNTAVCRTGGKCHTVNCGILSGSKLTTCISYHTTVLTVGILLMKLA